MSRRVSDARVNLPPHPACAANLAAAVALHDELQQQPNPLQLHQPLAMTQHTGGTGGSCIAEVNVVQQVKEQTRAAAADFDLKQPEVATSPADVASCPGLPNSAVQLSGNSGLHPLPSRPPASSAAAPKLFTEAENPMLWKASRVQGGASGGASAAVNMWGATTTHILHGYSSLLQPTQGTGLAQARPKLAYPTAAAGTVTATSTVRQPLKGFQTKLVPAGTTLRLEQSRLSRPPPKPTAPRSGDSSVFVKRPPASIRHHSKTTAARQLDLLLTTPHSTADAATTSSHQHIHRQDEAEGTPAQQSMELYCREAADAQHAAIPAATTPAAAAAAEVSGATSTHCLDLLMHLQQQQQQQHTALCSTVARGGTPAPCSSSGLVISGSVPAAASAVPGRAGSDAPALSPSQPIKVTNIILLDRTEGQKLLDAFAQNPTATALSAHVLAADTQPQKPDDHAPSSGCSVVDKDGAATNAEDCNCGPPTCMDAQCTTTIAPDAQAAADTGDNTARVQQQQQCLQTTLLQWEASRGRTNQQKISDYNLSEALWLLENCKSRADAAHLAVTAAGTGALASAATMQQAEAVPHDQGAAHRALTHNPAAVTANGCTQPSKTQGMGCEDNTSAAGCGVGGSSAAAAFAPGIPPAIPPTTAADMDLKVAANNTSNRTTASSCQLASAAATAVHPPGHTSHRGAAQLAAVAGAEGSTGHPAGAAGIHGVHAGAAAPVDATRTGICSELVTDIPPLAGAGPDSAYCWVATTPTKKTIRRRSTTTINTDVLLRTPAARPLTLSTLQAPGPFLQADYSPHPVLVSSCMSPKVPTTAAGTDRQAGADSSSPPCLISSTRPMGVHNLLLGWSPLPGLVQRSPGSAEHCYLSPQPGQAAGPGSDDTTGHHLSEACSVMSPGALIPHNPLSTLHPGTSPFNTHNRHPSDRTQHTSHPPPAPGAVQTASEMHVTQAPGEVDNVPVMPACSHAQTLSAAETGLLPPKVSNAEVHAAASQTIAAAAAAASTDGPQQLEALSAAALEAAGAAQSAEAAFAAFGGSKTGSHETTMQQRSRRLFQCTNASTKGSKRVVLLQQASGKGRGKAARDKDQGTRKCVAAAAASHANDGDAQTPAPAATEHLNADDSHAAPRTMDRCISAKKDPKSGCNTADEVAGTAAFKTPSTLHSAAEQQQASEGALPVPTILEAAACPSSLQMTTLTTIEEGSSHVPEHTAAADVAFHQPDTAQTLHQAQSADNVVVAAQAVVATKAPDPLPASSIMAVDGVLTSNNQIPAKGAQAATNQGDAAVCCTSELPLPQSQASHEQLVMLTNDTQQCSLPICCTPMPVTPAGCAVLPADQAAGVASAPRAHPCQTTDSAGIADKPQHVEGKQEVLHPPSNGATTSSGVGGDGNLEAQHIAGQLTFKVKSTSTGQQAPGPLGQKRFKAKDHQNSSILAGPNAACHLGTTTVAYNVEVHGLTNAGDSTRASGEEVLATHGAGQDMTVMLDPQFDSITRDAQTHHQDSHDAVSADAQLCHQPKQAPKKPRGAIKALHARRASAPQPLKLQGQGVKKIKEVQRKRGLSANAAAPDRSIAATALLPAVPATAGSDPLADAAAAAGAAALQVKLEVDVPHLSLTTPAALQRSAAEHQASTCSTGQQAPHAPAAPSRSAAAGAYHAHQQHMNVVTQSGAIEGARKEGGQAECVSDRNAADDGFPALFFDPEDPLTLRLRPRRAAAKHADKRMRQQQLALKHLNSNPSAHGTQPQTPAAAAAGSIDLQPAVTAVKHAAVMADRQKVLNGKQQQLSGPLLQAQGRMAAFGTSARRRMGHVAGKIAEQHSRGTAIPAAAAADAEAQPGSTCVAQQAKQQGKVGGRKRAASCPGTAAAAAAPCVKGKAPRGRPRKVRPTPSESLQVTPPAATHDDVPRSEAPTVKSEHDTSSKQHTASSSAKTDTSSDWKASGSSAEISSSDDDYCPTGNLNVLASAAAAHAAPQTASLAGAKRALPAGCQQPAAKRQHSGAAAAAGPLPASRGGVRHSRVKGGRPAGVGNRGQLVPFKGNDGFGCRSARFTGVYKAQRATVRWRTQFSYARKVLNVGCFATEEEAARAWNAAAMHFRGADCWVNPVEPVLPEDGGRKIAQGLPQPDGGSLLPVMRGPDTDA